MKSHRVALMMLLGWVGVNLYVVDRVMASGQKAHAAVVTGYKHHWRAHRARAEGWTHTVYEVSTPTVMSPAELVATPAELEVARAVAIAYWNVEQPPCGHETVSFTTPIPSTDAAQADFEDCQIQFSTVYDWRDFPSEVCNVYVHEFGHLVLGPTFFAAVNPSDPAHSPDPNNIMYGHGITEAAERSTKCPTS